MGTNYTEKDMHDLFQQDKELIAENVCQLINQIVESYSSNILVSYFHLSPVKIHLSFSLEGRLSSHSSSEEELLEWLISTVGIHFTEVSDAEIKYVNTEFLHKVFQKWWHPQLQFLKFQRAVFLSVFFC